LPQIARPAPDRRRAAKGWRMVYLGIMFRYALVIGIIGFVGGYFGPLIFAPEANQGPLLGIFITGPLGFIFGGVLGLIVAFVRERSQG
jgi:hypothetical protein